MHSSLRQLSLVLALLLACYGQVQAQINLKTGAPTPGTVCAGSTVSMTYELSGFPAGKLNYYLILAIPNSNGSFASIRTYQVTDTLSPLRVTLPTDLKTNSNYGLSVAISKPGNVTVVSGAKLFTVNAAPDPPTVVSPITYCQGSPASTLSATGQNLKWYDADGNPLPGAPRPLTTTPGTRTYYVTQTNELGCESNWVAVNVIVKAKPSKPEGGSPLTACQGSLLPPLIANGSNLKWYDADGNPLPGAPTPSTGKAGATIYYVTQTINGCESDRSSITVTVIPTPASPNLSANGPTTVLQGSPPVVLTASNCSGTLHWNGPNDSSGSGAITVPTTFLGQYTYSAVCVQNGCQGPTSSITVEVAASAPPTSNCLSFAALCSGNPQEVRTVNFTAPAEGDYQLVLTYQAPEKAVSALVRIDGSAQTIGLTQSRSYGNLSLGTFHLKAGSHTFQLNAGANGNYLCFNGLCLTPVGSSGAPSCNFSVNASPASSNVSCGGAVNLTANCSGGDCAGVSYTWSGTGLSQDGPSVQFNAPSANGSYTYSVTASRPGCTNQTAQTTVVVSGCEATTPPSSNSVCTTFAEVCSGNTREVRTQTFSVATEGDYEVRLSYKSPEKATTGLVILDGTSRTVGFGQARFYQYQSLGTIHLTAGTHTLQLSAAAGGNYLCFNGVCLVGSGSNNANCTFSLSSSVSSNAVSCGSTVNLAAQCNGACDGVSYNWRGPGVDQNSASVSFAVPSANGNYTYTATASKFGCSSQTTYQTIVVSGCYTDAPTSNCATFAEVCSGNPREVRTQTVSVAREGDYEVVLSYKSTEKATKGQIVLGGVTRTLDFSRTLTYQKQTAGVIHLTAGTHTLQLSAGAADNYLCFNGVCLNGNSTLTRLQSGSAENPGLQVTVLGNPVTGRELEVEVRGAEAQPLQLQLIDTQGKLMTERHVPAAQAVERHHLPVAGQAGNVLLLRVATPTQSKSLKVMKAQ